MSRTTTSPTIHIGHILSEYVGEGIFSTHNLDEVVQVWHEALDGERTPISALDVIDRWDRSLTEAHEKSSIKSSTVMIYYRNRKTYIAYVTALLKAALVQGSLELPVIEKPKTAKYTKTPAFQAEFIARMFLAQTLRLQQEGCLECGKILMRQDLERCSKCGHDFCWEHILSDFQVCEHCHHRANVETINTGCEKLFEGLGPRKHVA